MGSVAVIRHGSRITVDYVEASGGACELHAEFGSGDAFLLVLAPSAEVWALVFPWAAGRREAVLERVARELVRQESPGSRYLVHPAGVDILAPHG